MAKQKDNTTEQINNQNRLNESLKKQQEILGQIYALENDSLETYSDRLNLQDQLYSSAKLIATLGAKIDQFSESTSDRAKMLVEQYSGQRDLLDEIQSKYADIVTNSSNIAEDSFEIVDLAKEHSKLADLMLETELARDILGEKEYNKQKDLLDIIKDRLSVMDNINNTQSQANELAKKFLSENTLIGGALGKTFSKIESMAHHFGDHGVVGSILGKKASHLIETAQSDIKKKVVKAFQESGEAGVSAFSVAKMAAGSFVKYAIPALGILGVLGIFYGIIHAVQHLDEEMAEIAHKFSINREEADKLHHSAIDVAKEMNLVGINSEQVLNSMKETSAVLNGLSIPTQFAQGNEAVKEMVKDVTVLSEKFELGSEEIQGISNLSVITGKSIGQLVKESVKMGKGLLGTKKSIEVIAKLSPSMALNFKKGGMELLKAAQRAKLLGMELDQVQDFGEGILDFENSLEKEMEARVLTGKNINFDLARQYALNNDIAGLQQEMLTQLGSLNEFEKMNFLQRKSIAEAFGMTVDQVAKLLTAQERLNELGISQEKMDAIQAKNAAQLAEEAKTTSNEKLKGYLIELAKQKEVETISNRISDAVKKIKETLSATLAPLLEQVHHFLDSAEGAEFIKGTVEGIKTIMTGVVSLAKMFATGVAKINNLFGGTGTAVALIAGLFGTIATYFVGKALIVNGVKSLVSGLGSASGAASTLAGNMQNVANAAGGVSGAGGSGGLASAGAGFTSFAQNAAAVAVLLIAFAGALFITSKAFQEFAKVNWEGIKKGLLVMGLLTASVAALAGVAYLISGTGAIGPLYALAGATLALGASLLMSAEAFDIMSKVKWKGFEGMFTALTKVAGAFTMLGLASIPIMAGSVALTAAGISIGAFAGSVWLLSKGLKGLTEIGDLSKAGKNLVAGMKEMGKIPKMIDIDALEDSFDELEDALDELDFGDILAFSEIAKVDMSKAGSNLNAGLLSLAEVAKDVDLGKSGGIFGLGKKTGVIASLSSLDDAIGQLDLDGVKAFVEIAKTNFTNVGKNINVGLDSLREVRVGPEIKKTLLAVEDIFDWFEDALAELDFEQIKQFAENSMTGVVKFVDSFGELLGKLVKLPSGAQNILGGFAYYMEMFTTALNEIDSEAIARLNSLTLNGGVRFAKEFGQFIKELQSVKNVGPTLENFQKDMQSLNKASSTINSTSVTTANQNMSTGLSGKIKEAWSALKGAWNSMFGKNETPIQAANNSMPQGQFSQPKYLANARGQMVSVNSAGASQVTSTPITQTPTRTATPPSSREADSQTVIKKIDRVITLLETISKSGGDTVIKIGDRTIETIATSVERLKQQNPTKSGGRLVDVSR